MKKYTVKVTRIVEQEAEFMTWARDREHAVEIGKNEPDGPSFRTVDEKGRIIKATEIEGDTE